MAQKSRTIPCLDKLRFQKELSVEPASMDGEIENEEEVSALQIEIRQRSVEISAAEGVGVETPGSTPMQDEIAAVQNLLSGYNFSFNPMTFSRFCQSIKIFNIWHIWLKTRLIDDTKRTLQ